MQAAAADTKNAISASSGRRRQNEFHSRQKSRGSRCRRRHRAFLPIFFAKTRRLNLASHVSLGASYLRMWVGQDSRES
jgi:hypothetical protein